MCNVWDQRVTKYPLFLEVISLTCTHDNQHHNMRLEVACEVSSAYLNVLLFSQGIIESKHQRSQTQHHQKITSISTQTLWTWLLFNDWEDVRFSAIVPQPPLCTTWPPVHKISNSFAQSLASSSSCSAKGTTRTRKPQKSEKAMPNSKSIKYCTFQFL
jgi:hypothetical protein